MATSALLKVLNIILRKNVLQFYDDSCKEFAEIKEIVDNYMGYYNNSRYQWELAKLSPNEFYQFYTTGIYPLDISNKPVPPKPVKTASELGAEQVETDISNVTQT